MGLTVSWRRNSGGTAAGTAGSGSATISSGALGVVGAGGSCDLAGTGTDGCKGPRTTCEGSDMADIGWKG